MPLRISAMSRKLISTGSVFEKAGGYSRAVVDGDWVFVAGTTGFDYAAGTIPEDPVEQARNAVATVSRVLDEAGSSLADVVRCRYIATSQEAWESIVPVLGEAFADILPASTAIICDLVDPRMKFEIEVTAKKRAG